METNTMPPAPPDRGARRREASPRLRTLTAGIAVAGIAAIGLIAAGVGSVGGS